MSSCTCYTVAGSFKHTYVSSVWWDLFGISLAPPWSTLLFLHGAHFCFFIEHTCVSSLSTLVFLHRAHLCFFIEHTSVSSSSTLVFLLTREKPLCTFPAASELSPARANCFAGHFPCLSQPIPPTLDCTQRRRTLIPHIWTNCVQKWYFENARKFWIGLNYIEVGCANKSGRSHDFNPFLKRPNNLSTFEGFRQTSSKELLKAGYHVKKTRI